ncbi:MAG: hypothetical protein LUC24_02170 [Bacteroidales bacterium]|nr:hypothetical protein [Bacteroidales bacterium]
MQLKFEGNSSVDANTLIEALTAFQTVAETTDRMCGGKGDIRVKVDPARSGSGITLDLTLVNNRNDF